MFELQELGERIFGGELGAAMFRVTGVGGTPPELEGLFLVDGNDNFLIDGNEDFLLEVTN